jgi:EAL domain-containing protein (putative c-di-GMP-specific phosphodiesterase class I)/AmiR/NasT family two-component response regulator
MPPLPKIRLLVLDDEPEIAAFIGTIARDRGWNVEISTSESQFRRLYQANQPDVIVLDLQLGASDGVEQLRYLQQRGFAGTLALVSGFDARVLASARQVGESLGLRIVADIVKPVRIAQMREVFELVEQIWLSTLNQHQRIARPAEPALPPAAAAGINPAAILLAINAGQMELYLQPVVASGDRVVTRFEALIRWRHPHLGIVAPDLFIPVAEQDESVIDRLTMWVVETAVGQHRRLALLGCRVPISVNVSGVNLQTLDFPDRVVSLVQESGIALNGISFEVTETVAMRNARSMTDILTRLRLKGFALAMDDFGTGYSTLKVLRQMPFSEIKIDKSFVADALMSQDSFAIVRSVIELARNIGLGTVAEGVENEDTARLLRQLGADGLQGYHIGRPMPFDKAVEWSSARFQRQPDGTAVIRCLSE